MVDQGSEFKNDLVKTMCNQAGIKITLASTGRHETVGLVERYHRTLNKVIRAMSVQSRIRNWSKWIPSIAYKYNLSAHESLGGESPFYVRFGTHDDDHLVSILRDEEFSPTTVEQYMEGVIPELMEQWDKIGKIINEVRSQGNDRKNRNRKQKVFKIGQRVLLWWPRKWRKEGDPQNLYKYSREYVPAIVTSEVVRGEFYSCHTAANKRIETIVPVAHMKRYFPGKAYNGEYYPLENELGLSRQGFVERSPFVDEMNKITEDDSEDRTGDTPMLRRNHILDNDDKAINEGSESDGNYEPLVYTGNASDHDRLGWYFKCNGQIWFTFYLNFHRGYKQRCLWCVCDSDKLSTRVISRVISLKHFEQRYLPEAKRSKEELTTQDLDN